MWLYYLLITVMPLARHPLWSKFVGELTIIKYLGGVCVLYALVQAASRKSPLKLFASAQARWFLALFLVATLSFTITDERGPLVKSPMVSYISFLVLLFLTIVLVDSFERLRTVLLIAVGSVAFASIYLLREWQQNHNDYPGYRPGWVVGDSNYFSLSAVMCLPIAFYLMKASVRPWERLVYGSSVALILAAAVLAASRGGFLGMVAAGLYMGWQSKHRVLNLAGASACLVVLLVAVPLPAVQRMLKPSYGDELATEHRRDVWKAGMRMIADHPFLGVGLQRFKPTAILYAQGDEHPQNIAHNTYLEYAAEMGLPALFVFLGILYATLASLRRFRRRVSLYGGSGSWPNRAALGIEAGFIGYLVSIFFISAEYQRLFWMMIFLTAAMQALSAGLETNAARTEPMAEPAASGSPQESLYAR